MNKMLRLRGYKLWNPVAWMRNKWIDVTDQPEQTWACCLFIRFMNEVKEYALNDSLCCCVDCRNLNGPEKWNKFSLTSLWVCWSLSLDPIQDTRAMRSLWSSRTHHRHLDICKLLQVASSGHQQLPQHDWGRPETQKRCTVIKRNPQTTAHECPKMTSMMTLQIYRGLDVY